MLDRNSPTPLYAQLEDVLRAAIINREWEVNTSIPSEVELSKNYNLSRMTVRSVITTLVNEGLLYRVQGKGTFIAEPKIATRSLAYSRAFPYTPARFLGVGANFRSLDKATRISRRNESKEKT